MFGICSNRLRKKGVFSEQMWKQYKLKLKSLPILIDLIENIIMETVISNVAKKDWSSKEFIIDI